MQKLEDDLQKIEENLSDLNDNKSKIAESLITHATEVFGDVKDAIASSKSGNWNKLGQDVGDLAKILFLDL